MDKNNANGEDVRMREAEGRKSDALQKKQEAEKEMTRADLDKRDAAGPASMFGF